MIGEAIQKNSDYKLEELVINHDGLIEGMIRDSNYHPSGSLQPLVHACKIPGLKVYMTVDVRENDPNTQIHNNILPATSNQQSNALEPIEVQEEPTLMSDIALGSKLSSNSNIKSMQVPI
jgi:hypothetical protein